MKEIPLSRGRVALVDDQDYEALSAFKWYCMISGGKPYAARGRRVSDGEGGGVIYMHREIAKPAPCQDVDHLSGDTLDNRRRNLRPCSRSENLKNSRLSIGRGVRLCKQTGRWYARINIHQKRVFLGRFQSRRDAEMAVAAARAKEYQERPPTPSP